MVKIFVGRIPESIGSDKLRELFARYGKVTECEKIKDYGFVVRSSLFPLIFGMYAFINVIYSTWIRNLARRLPFQPCIT
jgi:RNA recognition motif-containing protein